MDEREKRIPRPSTAVLLVLLTVAACVVAGCASRVTPASFDRSLLAVDPDGARTSEVLRLTGPGFRGADLRDVSIPTLSMEADRAISGAGGRARWTPQASVTWLFIVAGVLVAGGVVVLRWVDVSLGLFLLAAGAGLAGMALNPWIGILAALAGLCAILWALWRVYMGHQFEAATREISRVVEAQPARIADPIKAAMRTRQAKQTPVSRTIEAMIE